MSNSAVHYLCNSPRPYGVPSQLTNYRTKSGTNPVFEAADKIRKKLHLDNVDTSYFWRPLILCMREDPIIASMWDWENMTMSFWSSIEEPLLSVDGASITGKADRPALNWIPDELPDSIVLDLTYEDEASIKYSMGSKNGSIPYTVYGDDLWLQSSEVLPGCDFGLKPDTAWSEGVTIRMKIDPARYPTDKALELVEHLPATMLLLSSYGMHETFSSSIGTTSKLGILALCIALATSEHGE